MLRVSSLAKFRNRLKKAFQLPRLAKDLIILHSLTISLALGRQVNRVHRMLLSIRYFKNRHKFKFTASSSMIRLSSKALASHDVIKIMAGIFNLCKLRQFLLTIHV